MARSRWASPHLIGCGRIEARPRSSSAKGDPKTKALVSITDEKKREVIGRAISPVTHVSKDSAPALIAHGDKDFLVPIQQAERIIDKFKAEKVPCKLVVKPGAGHGWAGMDKELVQFGDWFDEHLAKKK